MRVHWAVDDSYSGSNMSRHVPFTVHRQTLSLFASGARASARINSLLAMGDEAA